ncbi:hypothetical protein [Salinarimonas sp.]|uniref:hypothetical protein n=1 Tax=Salinarimonas sp. TaxID=2766526 RepID=UPI0032D90D48
MSLLPADTAKAILEGAKAAGLDRHAVLLLLLALITGGLLLGGVNPWAALGFLVVSFLLPTLREVIAGWGKLDEKRGIVALERDRARVTYQEHKRVLTADEPELPFEPHAQSGVEPVSKEGPNRD